MYGMLVIFGMMNFMCQLNIVASLFGHDLNFCDFSAINLFGQIMQIVQIEISSTKNSNLVHIVNFGLNSYVVCTIYT